MSKRAPESTIYFREAGDGYYRWLADDVSLHSDEEYWRLLKALHRKEFYYICKRDSMLSEDGLYMRNMYKHAFKGYDDSNLSFLPTCLEVLVAFAMRLEVGELDISHREWFWIFMENLGLEKFNDRDYDKAGGTDAVYYILSRWMNRRYRQDGKDGNIFTTQWIHEYNLKTMDFLAQGYLYIRENFGICGDVDCLSYYNDYTDFDRTEWEV